jgi:chromosome segregation and condensation protein ScpB
LLARGLLERTGNPEDGREYLYRPTVELLSHLGVRNQAELPNHAEIVAELETFEAQRVAPPTEEYE